MKSESLSQGIITRLNSLTKPIGSLGVLEEIVLALGLAQNTIHPNISRRKCLIFAGDHGISEEKVSAYPSEVTRQMLQNFAAGGAAANVLAKNTNTELEIIDMGVKGEITQGVTDRRISLGTKNFLHEPAMTVEETRRALAVGASFVEKGYGLFILGEMGIGNTTSCSAILAALTGHTPKEITGYGTGVDEQGFNEKVLTISNSLIKYSKEKQDSLSVLSRFGGFEIAALVGFILESSKIGIPILIDGFIVSTAALVALDMNPNIRTNLLFAHQSGELGHKRILNYLQVKPILTLEMRLGEGSGALVALSILDNALALYNSMATFESADVSTKRS